MVPDSLQMQLSELLPKDLQFEIHRLESTDSLVQALYYSVVQTEHTASTLTHLPML